MHRRSRSISLGMAMLFSLLLFSSIAFITPAYAADLDGNGKDDLVVDFGSTYGTFVYYNDATWGKLHNLSPEVMGIGDMNGGGLDEVVMGFAGYGTFVYYNNSTWTKLHSESPNHIATGNLDGSGGDEVIMDFPGYGTFVYDGTWTKIHSLSPNHIATGNLDGSGGDEVIMDFPGYGTFVYDGTWTKIHNLSPNHIATGNLDGIGGDEVIMDFGAYGTFVYNNGTWAKLHNLSPEIMVTGDLDGNGKDDVVLGFSGYGTFVYYNNTTWVKLHSLSPEVMGTGDLDGIGGDEVVLGFAGYGTFVYNNGTWTKLHSLSPEIIASEGNGGVVGVSYWAFYHTASGHLEEGPDYCTLTQSGGDVTGSFLFWDAATEITGTIDGTSISLSWSHVENFVEYQVFLLGTISGSTMAGTYTDTQPESGTWRAEKLSGEPQCIGNSPYYYEVYGAQAGDYTLTTAGHQLIGTSASGNTFNVSGYDRFIIYVPAISPKILFDAFGLDSNWVNSQPGAEYAHYTYNMDPTGGDWGSHDFYIEGAPDGFTIERSTPCKASYYGFSTYGASLLTVYAQ